MTPSEDELRDVRRTLAGWTVAKYAAHRGPRAILTLPHDATMEEALRSLSDKGVLSAPIVHRETGDYMGFCAWLVSQPREAQLLTSLFTLSRSHCGRSAQEGPP